MNNLTSIETDSTPETPETPVTRVGKIARLPRAVRTALNRRLADGEMGKGLVEWLNGLPETQAVLAAEFGGRAINEQNLSDWRRGGYVDWQRHEETQAFLRTLVEEEKESCTIEDGEQATLENRVSTLVLVGLSRLLQGPTNREAREQGKFLLAVMREMSRARQAQAVSDRVELEEQRSEREEQRFQFEQQEKLLELKQATGRMRAFSAYMAKGEEKAAEAEAENQGQAHCPQAEIKEDQAQSSRSKAAGGTTKPQTQRMTGSDERPEPISPDQGESSVGDRPHDGDSNAPDEAVAA